MRHGSQPTANRPPHLVASYDTQGGAEDVFYPDVPTGKICHSGECQAVYKHCAIHVHEAPDNSICPHLQIIKCCITQWDHGDELADEDDREILTENHGEGEEENSTLVLQAGMTT